MSREDVPALANAALENIEEVLERRLTTDELADFWQRIAAGALARLIRLKPEIVS